MRKIIIILTLASFIFIGCNNESKKGANPGVEAMNEVFLKGNLITNNYFTGKAWLNMLVTDKENFDLTAGKVLFEPGENKLHSHPGGQILLCTKGTDIIRKKESQFGR